MHVRMMPAQEPPYTRLIDSARRQPEQTGNVRQRRSRWVLYTRTIPWYRVSRIPCTLCKMMIVTLVDMS